MVRRALLASVVVCCLVVSVVAVHPASADRYSMSSSADESELSAGSSADETDDDPWRDGEQTGDWNQSDGDREGNQSDGDREGNQSDGDRDWNQSDGDREGNQSDGDREGNQSDADRNGTRSDANADGNRTFGDRSGDGVVGSHEDEEANASDRGSDSSGGSNESDRNDGGRHQVGPNSSERTAETGRNDTESDGRFWLERVYRRASDLTDRTSREADLLADGRLDDATSRDGQSGPRGRVHRDEDPTDAATIEATGSADERRTVGVSSLHRSLFRLFERPLSNVLLDPRLSDQSFDRWDHVSEEVTPWASGRFGSVTNASTGASGDSGAERTGRSLGVSDEPLESGDADDESGGKDGGDVPAPGSGVGPAAGLVLTVGYLGGTRTFVDGAVLMASPASSGGTILPRLAGVHLNDLAHRVLPAVFGYSRHDGSDALENDTRKKIYDLVRESPGTYHAQLAAETDVTEETVRYHSRILADEGLVESTKLRGRKRLYPVRTDQGDPELAAALADSAASDVLSVIERGEPMTLSAIADAIDCAPSTVSHHLDRLEDDGLVTRERDGSAVRIRLQRSTRSALRGSVADD